MITRRQFTKFGLGLAVFSQVTRQVFAPSTDGLAPKEGADIRRVGVRRHGEYWGLNNEMIDMLSGNLCYTVPLLTVGGRGVDAHIACSYNSQMWKKDQKNTYFSGADLGCGVGWRLHMGAIVPQVADGKIIGYLYIDSSGAEFPLTLSSGLSNIWASLQGLFISFDPENRCLSFPNGNFWYFDCISGPDEPDAGVLYPTVIEDTNGNQILINYMQGAGSTEPNSSSRITEVRDACSVNTSVGRRSYTFVYSQEQLPHLIAIASHLIGGKSYVFSYVAQQLISPFDNTNLETVNTLSRLQIEKASQYSFGYNGHGELTEAQIPTGGCLRWDYGTYGFAEGRKVREVVQRTLAVSSEDVGAAYRIDRNINEKNSILHGGATVSEPNGAQQNWTFCIDMVSPYLGMATSFEERDKDGQTVLRRTEYTWSQTTAGVPYKGSIATALDPGTADETRKKTEIVRDIFGNVTEQRQYDYNEVATPFKITCNTYFTEPAYLARNIYNRLVSTSVSDGTETEELVSYRYDTTPVMERPGTFEHDTENYGTGNSIRGNVTEVVRNGEVKRRIYYDFTGLQIATEDRTGKRTEHAPNGSWDLSTQINPEAGVEEIIEQITMKSWGRRWVTAHRSGIPELLTFDYEKNTIQTLSEKGWRKMTLDGFRRVVSIEGGKKEETLSVTEFEYDLHGGSAKSHQSMFSNPKRVSGRRAPGAKAEWVEYGYDSLGRVTKAGKSTFVHKGNSSLIMDGGGGWKKFIRRADGKLQKVVMPNPQSGPDLETTYRYNRKGKLMGVTMPRLDGTQKREFLSNADSSEVTSKQAESGQSKRMFNKDGTLASRTDAKGQRVVYGYDDKKRLVSVKQYDASGQMQPNQCVAYYYDTNPFDEGFSKNAKDRLAAAQWGSADTAPGLMMEMYSYTYSGKREAKRFRIQNGVTYVDLDLRYSYDGNGRIRTIEYPEGGPRLEYAYDETTGQPNQLMMGPDILVKDAVYDRASSRLVSYKQLVPGTGEYLEQSCILNSKHQVSSITAGFEGDANLIVDLDYEYDEARRLSKEIDHIADDITQYEYDASSRLKRASRSGNDEWDTGYSYDGFGNRVSQKKNKGAVPELTSAQDAATNQIVSDMAEYDANGNITKLFDMNLSFDVDNRLIAINRKDKGAEQYGYDPGNLRIWKKLATGEEEIHFYGSGGRRLATYKLTRNSFGMPTLTLMDSDIYFAGKLLSSKDKPVVLDRLGSVRAWIDSQSSVEQTKYYPFGEERQITRNNQRKFGTYMRDDFSELDYAEQRYYSSALGRFITPDPYAGSVLLGNPDTWNRYAYVKNDPVNNADPHGLAPYHNISGGWVSPEQVPCPNVPEPGQVLTNGPAVYTRDVFYKESEGQYYQALLYSLDQDGDPVWYVPPSRNEIYITIHILPTPAYGPPPYNWYHYPYNPVPIPEAYFTKNFSINWSGWAPFGVGLVDGSKPRKDYWLYFGCEEPRYKGGAGTIINKQQSCESPNWYEGLY